MTFGNLKAERGSENTYGCIDKSGKSRICRTHVDATCREGICIAALGDAERYSASDISGRYNDIRIPFALKGEW